MIAIMLAGGSAMIVSLFGIVNTLVLFVVLFAKRGLAGLLPGGGRNE